MAISSELLQSVRRDTDSLHQHPMVLSVSSPLWEEQEGMVHLTIDFGISLPSRCRVSGISSTGVKAVEPVKFAFQQSYPLHAPKIYLRHDFPRTFAHIQPGSTHTPPVPCIFYGDIDELFHSQGLWGITNQLADWLQKAALDELIDPAQGWEPVRRDNLEDIVVADLDFLRSHCKRQEQYYFFQLTFLNQLRNKESSQSKKQCTLSGPIEENPIRFSPKNLTALKESFSILPIENATLGNSIAMLATPGKGNSGKPFVANLYEPDTVSDIESLHIQAEKYGCSSGLSRALSQLKQCIKKLAATFVIPADISVPIVIVLGVRRPYNLIDQPSNIELVPYWLEIPLTDMLSNQRWPPVYPLALEQTISQDLLRTFSNQTEDLDSEKIALVGCGSLGSKIAIHLARAGHAPGRVIDKKLLSPHNAARHALLPEMDVMHLEWQRPKAGAVASAIRSLSQETRDINADASMVSHDSSLRTKLFPAKTKVIVNATASVTVREALAQLPINKLAARVVETSLFAKGQVGILSVEGPDRNPNTLDLLALTFQIMHDDPALRQLVLQQLESTQYQSTGQGCGSLTMRISDALISLFAASMTQGITSLLKEKLPRDTGRLLVGQLGQDGMSLDWQTHEVASCQVVQMDNCADWHVRIADRAHQKILAECSKYPTVETGGILLGRISSSTQSFLVTNVMPAPVDSQKTPNKFILGVEGVQSAIVQYANDSNGTLYCLGTWHSHLKTSEPSEEDYKTAAFLAKSGDQLSTMLIYTPSGYKAILAAKDLV